ncbi:MAG: RNA polymerase sigma factor [Flavobacteriaceae bacterium]|nr:RNA polymerase sigma factor [Flavobacteriaceae bacterium]
MTEREYIALIDPFKNKLFRFAKRFLVSVEEAEDATQDVLLKLWKIRDRLSTYKSPEAFAMTITKNHCLDRLKSKQAQNLKIVHHNYEDHNQKLQNKIEARDSLNLIEKFMKTLPVQQQLIVQLRDVEQYEFNEIADLLEMKETAIRVALSRARKTLREKLIQAHSYGITAH